jgi:thioredoxin reductase
VVLAAGITHFAYTPPEFAGFPSDLLSHSSDWGPLDRLRGRRVAVIGGGSSAIDLAAALHQEGAEVHVIARRSAIAFHAPPGNGPRSLAERISNPRSGLGLGWRSRLCTDAPLLFHRMPQKFRHRVVRSHLGPAPGWFVREKVEGVVPMHLGASVAGVVESGAGLEVRYRNGAGPARPAVDHLVAATGYRPLLERLTFLDQPLRAKLRSEEGTARLTANFESSVPGLYLVGLASANCFGPLARFAYGARFTARRLSAHLAGHA